MRGRIDAHKKSEPKERKNDLKYLSVIIIPGTVRLYVL